MKKHCEGCKREIQVFREGPIQENLKACNHGALIIILECTSKLIAVQPVRETLSLINHTVIDDTAIGNIANLMPRTMDPQLYLLTCELNSTGPLEGANSEKEGFHSHRKIS